MTNRVEDDVGDGSPTKRRKKGTRDDRLQEMAEKVVDQHDKAKKEAVTTAQKRMELYSRDALLPQAILQTIPYKQTWEALNNDDQEELRLMLCSFVVVLAQKVRRYNFNNMQKVDQKNTVKAFVYLDVLITLYRMPPQFEFAMGDLSGRFRGLPEAPLEQILQKFCKISVSDKSNMRARSMQLASSDSTTQFKFMKNKESVKTLILNIIGLVVHMSTTGVCFGSFLAKILKKDQKEL